ncbi:MAG TPA: hypothetical protein VK249_29450 [Anaerolineales bacterium]|nr:hypothetical protein [Anaerolineales bacterium]
MKNKRPILIAGLLVALLVAGVIGATSAYAQSPSNTPFHGRGPGGGDGPGMGRAELAAAAKALSMTTDELSSALQSGKTLEQLASDKGVDLQTVKDAINTVHREEVRSRIQQGLSDGTLSQEKADWLLEGLDKGFLDGPGFGFGPHGPGFGPGQQAQPTQQSSQ